MTSIEEQTSSEPGWPSPTAAKASSPAESGPPPKRSPARRLGPWVGGAAAVLLLGALTTVLVRGGGGGEAASPSSTALVTTAPPVSTTSAPSATAAPTTSAIDAALTSVAVATTAATTPPVVTPVTVAGSPPPPYQGPVDAISLNPGAANNATVATAAVGTVSVYRQPLMTPAPAFADWSFDSATQFGSPTVFLVTGTSGDWLRVQLPMKPNMIEGWVHNSEVDLSPNRHRIVVDLTNRTVTLYDGNSPVAESIAVVGKSGTPTPTGTYYVTDLLRLDDPSTAYGPYVLATSARSDAFDFFNGGEPIVALHGTNQPSLLGSAASNGCVRLPNEIATQLAALTPLGTPVFIV